MQLLKNPGFEEGIPNNWQNYNTGNSQIYTYPEQGRADGSSVAIEFQNREIGKVAAWVQNVQIDNTKRYKLSGWMKAQNIDGSGAIIKVDWKNSTGGYLGMSTIMTRQIGTFPWTYFEGEVIPSTGAVIATVVSELYDCSGKVWVDDILFSDVPPRLTTIVISPTVASIIIGESQQLSAICKDQYNNVMNCPILVWNSSNTGITTVDPTGKVTGISRGTANITASGE